MCIIVVKPKEKDLPSNKIFMNCWNNNRHGAGIMYHVNNKVIIKKGFMNFDDFSHEITLLKNNIDIKNTTMIFHFRISTSGNIDAGNCHPYPLTSSINELRTTNLQTDLGLAHNGIIHTYNGIDKQLNDTQLFIINDLYALYSLDNDFYKNTIIQSMITRLIDGSRLVFLNGNGEHIELGSWIEDDGYFFSNTSYTYSRYFHRKKINYNDEFEDIFNSNYKINNSFVEQEDYDLMMDYLENIPFGKKVFTKDGLDEYGWYDKNIFIDTADKSIYFVDKKTISLIGEYSNIGE